jgi:hypothetical protein
MPDEVRVVHTKEGYQLQLWHKDKTYPSQVIGLPYDKTISLVTPLFASHFKCTEPAPVNAVAPLRQEELERIELPERP